MRKAPEEAVRCGVPISTRLAGPGERSPNAKKFDLLMVASTGRVARDGGIIRATAWKDDLSLFRSNPVIMWAHDYRYPPIAVAVDVKVNEKRGSGELNGALMEWWRFLTEITDDEWDKFAGRIKALYAVGGLRASSVGFLVRESGNPTQDDIDEAKERDEPTPYWVALRAELLETSAVPVPADPYALAVDRALKAAAVKGADMKDLNDAWEHMKRTGQMPDQIEALAQEFTEHRSGIFVPKIPEPELDDLLVPPRAPDPETEDVSPAPASAVSDQPGESVDTAGPGSPVVDAEASEVKTIKVTHRSEDVVEFEEVAQGQEVEPGDVIVEAELTPEEERASKGLFNQLLSAIENDHLNPERSPVPRQVLDEEAMRRIAREEIREVMRVKFGVFR
jgi:hypothetical protein